MKRNILLFLIALLPLVASAYDAKINGIYYNFSGDEAEVTYESSSLFDTYNDYYSGAVVIPDSVTYNGKTYKVTSVGDYAFHFCKGLTSVKIPNSVTSIGRFAFSDCIGLTSVNIPNSVTSIGFHAFWETAWYESQPDGLVYAGKVVYEYKDKGRMPRKTQITLKDGTIGIAGSAFSGCSGLTSITIPKSVTNIGDGAFEYCNGLTSIKVETGNTKYDSRDNCNAIIETTTNTLIAGCRNTVIPNSVTSIGNRAFGSCNGLTTVTIPEGVTTIGYSAFKYCRNLRTVTIPNSVTSIGNRAFGDCNSLTSITIPKSVTSIGWSAFEGCFFRYDSLINHTTLTSNVNWGATLCDEETTGGLIIKNDTIVKCMPWATSVTIPDSVTTIGYSAFRYCNCLTSIKVDAGNTVFDSRDNCNAIIETATNTLVVGCKNTVIPNSVTSIGDMAFDCNSSLKSIKIPKNIKSIGYAAFRICTSLTSVKIPKSVSSIGDIAFGNCSNLKSIKIPQNVTSIGYATFRDCSSLKSIKIPKSVTSIDVGVFSGSSNLKSIKIPESVTSIGSNAFWGTAWYDSQPDGLVYAGKVAYKYKGKMPKETQITIKEGTLGIAGWAFKECRSLKSVTIPESVITIGDRAFDGCTGIDSIIFPNNVTSIGSCAFQGTAWYDSQTDGLVYVGKVVYGYKGELPEGTQITIKEGTVGIADDAFWFYDDLTSVTIPESVTTIGSSAFSSCYHLTNVYCYAKEVPKTGSNAFKETPIEKATLHVPAASIDKYKAAKPWSNFGKIVAIEEEK